MPATGQKALDCFQDVLGASTLGFYHRVLTIEVSSFADRLQIVEGQISRAAQRSGRSRADIKLVAVSKKFSAEHIRKAYAAGVRAFGENYVQEFAEKRLRLEDLGDAEFHFIGHLQTNKARQASRLFQVLQTVDSVRLLQKLDEGAQQEEKNLDVLFEVKLSAEQSKTGAPPEGLPGLLAAVETCTRLRLRGLMTMPPWSENAEQSRPYFKKLAALGREYGLPHLSMGMSNDFEVAIEEGATIIRLGTILFGPRPKPGTGADVVSV
jgi:PLP dependent protein